LRYLELESKMIRRSVRQQLKKKSEVGITFFAVVTCKNVHMATCKVRTSTTSAPREDRKLAHRQQEKRLRTQEQGYL
jgi:hypothetical protein